MEIPHCTKLESTNLFELYEKIDVDLINNSYTKLYNNYQSFLQKQGILLSETKHNRNNTIKLLTPKLYKKDLMIKLLYLKIKYFYNKFYKLIKHLVILIKYKI